jgi:hypothetical protein
VLGAIHLLQVSPSSNGKLKLKHNLLFRKRMKNFPPVLRRARRKRLQRTCHNPKRKKHLRRKLLFGFLLD